MVAAGYIDQATADQAATVGIGGQLVDAYEGKSETIDTHLIFDAVITKRSMITVLTEEEIVTMAIDLHRIGPNKPAHIFIAMSISSHWLKTDVRVRKRADPKTVVFRVLMSATALMALLDFNYATWVWVVQSIIVQPSYSSHWSTDKEG